MTSNRDNQPPRSSRPPPNPGPPGVTPPPPPHAEIVRLLRPTGKLLPIGAVARRLRVTKAWLLCEAQEGRIPALRAGKQWLCDLEAVEAALLKRARKFATDE